MISGRLFEPTPTEIKEFEEVKKLDKEEPPNESITNFDNISESIAKYLKTSIFEESNKKINIIDDKE